MLIFANVKRILSISVIVAALLSAVSCNLLGSDPVPEPSTNQFSRVAIMYSIGFNSLSSWLADDNETMIGSAEDGYLPPKGSNRAMILVTHGTEGNRTSSTAFRWPTTPYVIRVTRDHLGRPVCDTLLTLDTGKYLTVPDVMNEVLGYVQSHYPADSYGLVLSSHGSGWLPKGYYEQENPPTKSFGQELHTEGNQNHSYEMTLQELHDGIPSSMHLDYILMDACLMGGIETAFELRDKTDFIGFSQAEILADGFDYSKLMYHLLVESPMNPQAACEDYFNKCQADKSTLYRSATISYIDCTRLDPLADVCKVLFDKYRPEMDALYDGISKWELDNMDAGEEPVQGFFRFHKHWYYDLEDILVKSGISTGEQADLKEALDACVLYKAATERLFDDFDVHSFCGFSMYLPCRGNYYLNERYKNLKWNSATGLVK